MDDNEYVAMVEALAVNDTTTCIVPQSLQFFTRYGPVPYANGGAVAAALGVTLTELKSVLPNATMYGDDLLEFDDLWDDLIALARNNHPGAARLWLTLYRDNGMPIVNW